MTPMRLVTGLAVCGLTACAATPSGEMGESPPALSESEVTAPSQEQAAPTEEVVARPLRTPQEAYAAGLAFLIADQNEDGSWGGFESARVYEIYLDNLSSHRAFRTATSALCVMALQDPSRSNPDARAALDRGLEYLLTAEPPGRASGSTFYNTWAHTYVTQALAALHGDDRFADQRERITEIAERELATMRELQMATGGWGYYDFGHSLTTPTGDMSTSFNTGAAILALLDARDAGFKFDESMISDATVCLERLRLPSGAYVYGVYAQYRPDAGFNKVKGSLGRSQPCNLALLKLQRDITVENLQTGLEDLRTYHHFIEIGRGRPMPHEAWYSTAGYYFFFGHYYAGRVINTMPEPVRTDFAAWMSETMARLQDDDGSWFDFPLYGYYKQYGTAFALLTLEACRPSEVAPVTESENQ